MRDSQSSSSGNRERASHARSLRRAWCTRKGEASLKDWGPKTKINETHFIEVTAFVYSWNPNSDAASGFYLLVTATCQPLPGVKKPTRLDQLTPWDFASEGGVQVKIVSKAR